MIFVHGQGAKRFSAMLKLGVGIFLIASGVAAGGHGLGTAGPHVDLAAAGQYGNGKGWDKKFFYLHNTPVGRIWVGDRFCFSSVLLL
jgi:hypothetical protein